MINDIITQKKIVDTLDCVGDYGPLLLFALSLVLLRQVFVNRIEMRDSRPWIQHKTIHYHVY